MDDMIVCDVWTYIGILVVIEINTVSLFLLGNKSGQDDYSSRKGEKAGGRRDSTPDVTRITALSNRKEKEKVINNNII